MSAAAQKLYLTQPAVSQQIRTLEEQLEVKLIIRAARPSMPTIEGQLLYDYAKKVLNLIQQTEVALNTVSKKIEGTYSIGTVNTLGLHFLSPVTGLLLRFNPKINLKMVYLAYDIILDKFENGELDGVILADILQEESDNDNSKKRFDDFDAHLLNEDEVVLVSSAQVAGVPSRIQAKDINKFPIVFFNQVYKSFQRNLELFFEKNKIDFYPVFECNNVGTAKRIIEYGVGWGFLPYHSVKKQIHSQRLQVTHVEGLNFKIGLYLYAYKSERSKQLIDLLYSSLKHRKK